jgi:hypothetical protein
MTLSSLVDDIDDNIKQNPFFLARNGQEILANNTIKTSSGDTLILSGSANIPVSAV